VHFREHILECGNHTKFLSATKAHQYSATEDLCTQIEALMAETTIASADLRDLKETLVASQELNTALKSQCEASNKEYQDLMTEHRALMGRIGNMEQQIPTTPRR
jgi:chromosome segregation ATPase